MLNLSHYPIVKKTFDRCVCCAVFLLLTRGNKNTSQITTVPNWECVLDEIGETLVRVYQAIESGVSAATEHFAQSGIPIGNEKHAFSSLVRLHAKQYLNKHKLRSMEIEHTNLCGLWLRAGSYKIKVWHLQDADYDELNQECSPLLAQYTFTQDGEPYSVIPLRIYWRVRPENRLLEVFGAIPKYDDPKSLECYCFKAIADPATNITTPESSPTGDVVDDLQIARSAEA